MVVGSLSYTVVSFYAATATFTAPAPTAAPAPAPVARDADEDGHGRHGHRHHGGGGIVDAVRTALRELLPSAAADATAAPPAAGSAPSAPATKPGADVDDFAHALWRALRDAPSSAAAQKTERRYGDLPQRLETLAAALDAPGTAPDSGLVDAFGSMLQSLRGAAPGTGDARSLLAGFLHRIATALGSGTGAAGSAPTGQLVSTRA